MLSNDERNCYITNDLESIQKLINDVGRDILDFIASPNERERGIQAAFRRVKIDNLATLFDDAIDPPDSISHRLTLLLQENDLESLDGDDYLVKFKSHEIRRRATEVFEKISLEDRKQLPSRKLADWLDI